MSPSANVDGAPSADELKLARDDYQFQAKQIRTALNAVSTFDGTTPAVDIFIREYTSLQESLQFNEKIFVPILMASRLTDRARIIYNIEGPISDIQTLSTKLKELFKERRSFDYLRFQRSKMCQQQGTSLLEYTTQFQLLQHEIILEILEDTRFSPEGKRDLILNEELLNAYQYVRGLLPDIRDRVQHLRPTSISEASNHATQAYEDIELNKEIDSIRASAPIDPVNDVSDSPSTVPTEPVSTDTPLEPVLNLKDPHTRKQMFTNARRTIRQRQDATRPIHRYSKTPYNDHLARSSFRHINTAQIHHVLPHCPPHPTARTYGAVKSVSQRSYTKPFRCLTCNGPHDQSLCPVSVNLRGAYVDVAHIGVSTLEEVLFSPEGDDEVVVILDFPAGPKSFVIDTGARINIIKSSAARDCPTINAPSSFTGIGGGVVHTTLKAQYCNNDFFIVDDTFPLQTDGLLGRSYLRSQGMKLDFSTPDVVRTIPDGTPLSREELLRQNLRLDHLDAETKEIIWKIQADFIDVFSLPGDPLPATNITTHKIVTTDNVPVQVKQYRHPPGHQDIIAEQTSEMLKNNIIEESSSPYNSPLWVVPKKSDASGLKKWRIVTDYRLLNEKTPQDKYPLPNMEDIFDKLGRARYFSALDLHSGFHQIMLDEQSRHKTAFSTPDGHYQYKRMPFGLKNAPPTFQRMIDQALRGLIGKGIFVYLDDIIVCGESLDEHNANLQKLYVRLREVGLKLQPHKCEFLVTELQYLGHLITPSGIKPNPFKLSAVAKFPEPKSKKHIKQFLGLAGYYRKFIKDFSKIASPLLKLLRADQEFIFTESCRLAFNTLRAELCSDRVLMFPNFAKPFFLTTDACDYAIGGVLEQLDDNNQRRPIAYASRTLNSAEKNYSTIEKELLAIVWAVKHFRPYLYGRKFTIRTDHQPLKWLFNLKDPSSRLMRWRIKLEEYDYVIEYVKGQLNTLADALSRNPVLLVRWKQHIHETPQASELAIPVYFSRKEVDKFKIIRSPEDESLLAMRISLENITKISLQSMLEEVVMLLLSEEKNLVFLEYEKLLSLALLPSTDINSVIKTVFNDPLITVELGTQPLLSAHTQLEKTNIIQDYHDSLQAGHQGITKTLKMILKRYYWRGIQKDVSTYISNCPTCQKAKHDRIDRKAPRQIVTLPVKRNEKIALDIVGPLPATKDGNVYILTLQDCLTKFVQAYPLKEQTTVNILHQLITQYFPSHGLPKSIMTDQGRNFTSQLNSEFCELFKIKHVKCSPFHPESNGSLERMHGTMKEYLKANTPNIADWDKTLPFFVLYYNSIEHTSTGISPFTLTYGSEPFQLTDLQNSHGRTYDDFLTDLQNKLDFVWNQAKLKDLRIKVKLTDKFNETRSKPPYQPGQRILLRADESRKLGKGIRIPFDGPFLITKVISDQNIEINHNGTLETVHVNRVRPYKTKDD